MGVFRFGSLIKYIPHTITTGFTTGIAVTLIIGQIKDFLGLTFVNSPIETVEKVEDEHFITVNHDMTKSHFISFIAYLTTDKVQFVKLYPEGNAETRFTLCGSGYLYIYCNKHGLMRQKI